MSRHLRKKVDGQWAPSANDEYLLYQTLLAIWPVGELDDQGLAESAPAGVGIYGKGG